MLAAPFQLAACVALVCASAGDAPKLRRVSTEHLGQLTGARERALGLTGTDLGVSFVDPGSRGSRLVFLFGDAWTPGRARDDEDSAAWTTIAPIPDRDPMPSATWFLREDHQFARLTLPRVPQGGMEVPVEALVIGERTYVFASAGWDAKLERHSHSALAHCDGAFRPDALVLDHLEPSERFVNVSCVLDDDVVWIFGTGAYRKSDVYLANAPAARIADRRTWRYFRAAGAEPDLGAASEGEARPLISPREAGELCVRRVAGLGFVMLYNSPAVAGAPRGILLQRADQPWGPWDPPLAIFDPSVDGYGRILHARYDESGAGGVAFDDGLSEPGVHTYERETTWGGEYGAYLVEPWCERRDQQWSLVYTLSTWVPYQVQLMRTVVALRDSAAAEGAPPRRETPDLPRLDNAAFERGDTSDWHAIGDEFAVFADATGRKWVTTYTPSKKGEAIGELWQEFVVTNDTKALRFFLHGGEGRVELSRGEQIVRSTRGRAGHEPRNEPKTEALWNLEEFADERVRLVIRDDRTGPWGFVGATGFEFVAK